VAPFASGHRDGPDTAGHSDLDGDQPTKLFLYRHVYQPTGPMFEETWQYRKSAGFATVDGVLVVGNGSIHLRPGLRQFLPGETAGGHADHRPERGLSKRYGIPLLLLGVGVAMGGLGIVQALEGGIVGTGALNLFGAATTFVGVWDSYLRETTVPLSSVERVSVNESDGELTIEYEQDSLGARAFGRLHSWNAGTETLVLAADGAVGEVRRTLRRRGVSVEDVTEVVDTDYRFTVEDGAYFCESCGRQVSPADDNCPSCGYALHQKRERPVSSASP
jgi:hypothetical protein